MFGVAAVFILVHFLSPLLPFYCFFFLCVLSSENSPRKRFIESQRNTGWKRPLNTFVVGVAGMKFTSPWQPTCCCASDSWLEPC